MASGVTWTTGAGEDVHFIHSFDTDGRDLQQAGYLVELREREGRWLIVFGPAGEREAIGRTEAQIDGAWASQILSAEMSPIEALERRLSRPVPRPLEHLRAMVAGRRLVRVASRAAAIAPAPVALRRSAS